MCLLFFIVTIVLIVIECQRTPFDVSEGERELVRGFSTEISSVMFVLVFLREYLNLLLLRFLLRVMWFKINFYSSILTLIVALLFRACFPRLRYDLALNIA